MQQLLAYIRLCHGSTPNPVILELVDQLSVNVGVACDEFNRMTSSEQLKVIEALSVSRPYGWLALRLLYASAALINDEQVRQVIQSLAEQAPERLASGLADENERLRVAKDFEHQRRERLSGDFDPSEVESRLDREATASRQELTAARELFTRMDDLDKQIIQAEAARTMQASYLFEKRTQEIAALEQESRDLRDSSRQANEALSSIRNTTEKIQLAHIENERAVGQARTEASSVSHRLEVAHKEIQVTFNDRRRVAAQVAELKHARETEGQRFTEERDSMVKELEILGRGERNRQETMSALRRTVDLLHELGPLAQRYGNSIMANHLEAVLREIPTEHLGSRGIHA